MVSPSSDDLRTWADAVGPDTPLARLLLLRGRLPLDLLQATLDEVRAARPEGGTLARRLVERGLVQPAELEEWRALLAAEAGGTQGTWPGGRATRDEGLEAWRPGAVVAEHRLVSRIGAGGMGAVDLAEHLPTGARRAIKSIPAGADADLVLRFQREAEAMARAGGHPAVARIHAVGHALGRLYLVLDLLPGGDLEQRLRTGPLPAAEVARLGVALAGGLAHVHARGFLHRDLKPSNVLFDDAGRPVLVDFGLVRATGAAQLTRTGDLLGTPAYMAPEQALGLAREQDERTDVHGLGAVLYRALTGQLPFEGSAPYEVLEKVIHAAPRPPSSLVKGVPPALDVAILRALAKAPADRFQTTGALGAALSDVLTSLAPRDPVEPARRFAALLGLLGLGLGLVLGAGGMWALGPRDHPPVESPRPPRSTSPPPPKATPGVATPASASPPTRPDRASALPATVEGILRPPEVPPASIGEEFAARWRNLREVPGYGRPLARLQLAVDLKDEVAFDDRPPNDPQAVVAAQLLRDLAREEGALGAGAWRELSYAFELGVGVQRSDAQAAACLAASSQGGDELAMVLLACALRDGTLAQPVDRGRARALLRRAARPGGPVERRALVELARLEVAEQASAETLKELGAALREEGEEIALLAAIRGRLGDPAAEEATLRRHLTPETSLSASTFVALHTLLLRAGRADEAADVLTGLERYTGRADVDLALARLHRDAGRPAVAARWYAKPMRAQERMSLWSATDAAIELLALCEAEVAAGRRAPADAAALERFLRATYEGRARLDRLRRSHPR